MLLRTRHIRFMAVVGLPVEVAKWMTTKRKQEWVMTVPCCYCNRCNVMSLTGRVVRPGLVACCSVVYKGQTRPVARHPTACCDGQWRVLTRARISHLSSIVTRYESLFCSQCLGGLMFVTQRHVRHLGTGFGGEVTLTSNRCILFL